MTKVELSVPVMRFVAGLVLHILLLGAACAPAHAQSEFLGETFPYKAFDTLPTTPIAIGGATLNVGFAPGKFALPRSALIAWLETSAKAVSVYFGKFPVGSARILIVPVPGGEVQGGASFGYRGAAIRLLVGSDVTEAELADDWKAVHEMTHLALPDVHPPHIWLAEGLATYVEPIARVEAGELTAEKIWGDMLRDMKQGLPEPGDRGLDGTDSWGRTYWGGAMFCLLADVEIRKQTGNARVAAGAARHPRSRRQHGAGSGRSRASSNWATRRPAPPVLTDLYAKMGYKPYAPDLDALWRDLGVSMQGGRVSFDDSAPFAPIRRAITAVPAG